LASSGDNSSSEHSSQNAIDKLNLLDDEIDGDSTRDWLAPTKASLEKDPYQQRSTGVRPDGVREESKIDQALALKSKLHVKLEI